MTPLTFISLLRDGSCPAFAPILPLCLRHCRCRTADRHLSRSTLLILEHKNNQATPNPPKFPHPLQDAKIDLESSPECPHKNKEDECGDKGERALCKAGQTAQLSTSRGIPRASSSHAVPISSSLLWLSPSFSHESPRNKQA